MIYADYDFYTDEYHGTTPEQDYNRLSVKASAYIDQVTFDRIGSDWESDERLADRIRMACCAVADAYHLNEQGGGVASETNDGYSVNYVAGISNAKTDDQRLYEAVAMYLGRTGLMYAGV